MLFRSKNQLGTLKLLLPLLKKDKSIAFAFAGGIIDNEYLNQINALAETESIKDQVKYLGEVTPGKELNTLYSN